MEKRQTVFVTSNGCDHILLVDENDGDRVIGAWMADDDRVADYLRDGADASNWEATWPDNNAIGDYGTECGRGGQMTDDLRIAFWAESRRSGKRVG